MNKDLEEEKKKVLEQFVDENGLQAILESLSEICGVKADHIRDNWQDNALAKRWAEAGGVLGILVTHGAIARVSTN